LCWPGDTRSVAAASDSKGRLLEGGGKHVRTPRQKEHTMNLRTKRMLLLAVAALALAAPALANAAPPANDAFASAGSVNPATLPFSASVSIDEATVEAGEPVGCYGIQKSVWYQVTPSSSGWHEVDVETTSLPDRVITVYRQQGSGFGGLSLEACLAPYAGSATAFWATAGVTYYVQAGGFYTFSTGTLSLSLRSVPPPGNDNFAAAQPVTAVPYHDTIELTAATGETGEPFASCGPIQGNSAWYAFRPAQTGSYTLGSSQFHTTFAAFTGTALASLTQVGCQTAGSPLIFHADAGTTTYLRVTGGRDPYAPFGGSIELTLDATPAPVAQFTFDPPVASVFDAVSFYDQTYDPAGLGVQSETWDFGDGTTTTIGGCCSTSHRYAADGTYQVTLTITTPDGRTDHTSLDLVVKTHDVAITDVSVPDSIRVGSTKTVTVGISNGRYPEAVRVSLFKSVGGSGGNWQFVGELTQYVPVKKGRRTVDFSFNYTATPDDAVLGKITFMASAVPLDGLDAIPADNSYISLPVKVKR
jgi:PKD repeat protein